MVAPHQTVDQIVDILFDVLSEQQRREFISRLKAVSSSNKSFLETVKRVEAKWQLRESGSY